MASGLGSPDGATLPATLCGGGGTTGNTVTVTNPGSADEHGRDGGQSSDQGERFGFGSDADVFGDRVARGLSIIVRVG